MTFENNLLVDYMPHQSMFNPPFSAMSYLTPFMGTIQMVITCHNHSPLLGILAFVQNMGS
jgi:hypothetical protein